MTVYTRKNTIRRVEERISLTAFFPAYNDQHTIEGIVRTAAEEMRKVTDNFEVLVVDDGSKDETGKILDRLAVELPYLRVIHHERNLGYGAALISGFKNAKKDLIFYTDGDGQYDVREMHNLLAELRPDIDLLYWWLPQINFVAAPVNVPRSDNLLVEPDEPAADQLLKA